LSTRFSRAEILSHVPESKLTSRAAVSLADFSSFPVNNVQLLCG
jgi:hypothetical protein